MAWAELDAATRSSIKAKYNDAGIKLIVSAFGSTDTPTSSQADPTKTATTMAKWVKKYGLDGIDVDYEVRLPLVPVHLYGRNIRSLCFRTLPRSMLVTAAPKTG